MKGILNFFFVIFLSLDFVSMPLDALTKEDIPIIRCPSNLKSKRKCELAITAIFRDEADYLKEWIEYHLLTGASHFYLYNNLSQDQYREVLDPYIKKGVVELFDVPFDSYEYNDRAVTHNFVQVCCYNHAIDLARDNHTWLAIIDSDEFICPVVDKTITKALSRYSYAGGVMVYWQVYGTSNVWDLDPGELLIEKLLLKAPNLGRNGFFKSIVRPKYAECKDPHWTIVHGLPLVIPNHQPFSHTRKFSKFPVDIIRINHYTFRTESHYWNHKRARRKKWGDNPTPKQARDKIDYHNSEYDPAMLPFVKELKKRMF